MADTLTLKLKKPIQAHGELVEELEIRKPTVAELRACGAPYEGLSDNPREIRPHYGVCAKLLIGCAGIPPSSIDQLDTGDFNAAALIIMSFTLGGTGEEKSSETSPPPSSTPPSTSPGSGN